MAELQLFAHPFSSYCWKVLVALWANETPFTYRMLDPDHLDNGTELARRWPFGTFPVLVDGERTLPEASIIIEYLDLHHPGPHRFVPTGEDAIEVRLLDRIFDNNVMTPMQKIVANAARPFEQRDPAGVGDARKKLDTAYAWLDAHMTGREWASGDTATLADCAAAPSLFYADWAHPIPAAHVALKAYRARLLEWAPFARAVEEARPYRGFFPLGAPDRD